LFKKRFKWCWKREKALCKKVVQEEACVAWLVSNDWDCMSCFCMSCLMSFW
jgi:hypothetical protein